MESLNPKIITKHRKDSNNNSCSGYCVTCGKEHHLYEGTARKQCIELIIELEKKKTIDIDACAEESSPRYSTDYLFGEALGQMFGILVCEDRKGEEVILKAFSGQYNSIWNIEGWVPPLFDTNEFNRVSYDVEKEIKKLGKQIDMLPGGSEKRAFLVNKRKKLSQNLMKDIHSLYRLTNFNGLESSLLDAFIEERGIPTGTGDCCAPKLLSYAAENNLTPTGIAEFYFGKTNKSGTKTHKQFYTSCDNKCRPILGFLLCGLER